MNCSSVIGSWANCSQEIPDLSSYPHLRSEADDLSFFCHLGILA